MRETARARRELVASFASLGELGQPVEFVLKLADEAVGPFAAVVGEEGPDLSEIGRRLVRPRQLRGWRGRVGQLLVAAARQPPQQLLGAVVVT